MLLASPSSSSSSSSPSSSPSKPSPDDTLSFGSSEEGFPVLCSSFAGRTRNDNGFVKQGLLQ
uniref:Uncharacterized protein n=1 Tax=Amphimedon queenslandica TaxID=400682 RepID=A0A1X7TZ17_AMPQE